MTNEQSQFWGAIAQILPVLALALVIEVKVPRMPRLKFDGSWVSIPAQPRRRTRRLIARIDATAKFMNRLSKVLEVMLAIAIGVLVLLFLYVEFYALVYLSGDKTFLDPDADGSRDRVVAIVTVIFGLSMVAILPVMGRWGARLDAARSERLEP